MLGMAIVNDDYINHDIYHYYQPALGNAWVVPGGIPSQPAAIGPLGEDVTDSIS